MENNWALVLNGQIIVGPRDWHYKIFASECGEREIPIDNIPKTMPSGLVRVSENAIILPVKMAVIPSYDSKYYQLEGPFLTVNPNNITGYYNVVQKPLEQIRNEIKDKVAKIRYEIEVGGVTVGDDIIATDRASQAMIHAAQTQVRDDPSKTFNWKVKNGWKTFDATAIENIADAVVSHVEAAFNNEYNISQALDAATSIIEIDEIDITDGWPPNNYFDDELI